MHGNETMHDFGSDTRWKQVNITELYCAHGKDNSLFLKDSCPVIDPAEIRKTSEKLAGNKTIYEYDFGMYGDVVESQVGSVNLRDFPKKFFYCFWWALGNLSTFGEKLKPGNSATDIFLAILMCACGLFLVAVLIGNVQKYLLSSTVRADEMNERKRDIETWMTYRNLPEELKKRIKENEKALRKNLRGTDEESLLRRFPEDLRRETQLYLDEHSA
ncbi:PREDICTED: cyclic nucleotide-gated ion channel 11 isoform X1 [Camelina sativa]|uniref:Cyclic nucleotide-gated ion channel 11 isoform X1 n=1 Tax=Camelina sativa TaxID=90675 RepID=A0ABM0ZJW0_CAMSA|nr:PREDICTED: cyclic nucleotide-gated ion channel 11 isoform X1 [Camelina sativa]